MFFDRVIAVVSSDVRPTWISVGEQRRYPRPFRDKRRNVFNIFLPKCQSIISRPTLRDPRSIDTSVSVSPLVYEIPKLLSQSRDYDARVATTVPLRLYVHSYLIVRFHLRFLCEENKTQVKSREINIYLSFYFASARNGIASWNRPRGSP